MSNCVVCFTVKTYFLLEKEADDHAEETEATKTIDENSNASEKLSQSPSQAETSEIEHLRRELKVREKFCAAV